MCIRIIFICHNISSIYSSWKKISRGTISFSSMVYVFSSLSLKLFYCRTLTVHRAVCSHLYSIESVKPVMVKELKYNMILFTRRHCIHFHQISPDTSHHVRSDPPPFHTHTHKIIKKHLSLLHIFVLSWNSCKWYLTLIITNCVSNSRSMCIDPPLNVLHPYSENNTVNGLVHLFR